MSISKQLQSSLGFSMTIKGTDNEIKDDYLLSNGNYIHHLNVKCLIGRYAELKINTVIIRKGKPITVSDVAQAIVNFYNRPIQKAQLEALVSSYEDFYKEFLNNLNNGKSVTYADVNGGLMFVESFTQLNENTVRIDLGS